MNGELNRPADTSAYGRSGPNPYTRCLHHRESLDIRFPHEGPVTREVKEEMPIRAVENWREGSRKLLVLKFESPLLKGSAFLFRNSGGPSAYEVWIAL